MLLTDFCMAVLLVALLAAFGLTLLRKWGAIEWLQVHGCAFLAKLASCDFCLSWWAGVALSVLAALLLAEPLLLAVPFFSTMITRILL